MRRIRTILVTLALTTVPLLHTGPAHAATITVTTTDDELNADGDCSLREAVQAANQDLAVDGCGAGNGSDTINVPQGTYGFTIPSTDENDNLNGDLDIRNDPVTIAGPVQGSATIDANDLDRAFHVVDPVAVTMSHLVITDGTADAMFFELGGGILGDSVTITDSMVTFNTSIYGGGMFGGNLTILRTSITANSATNSGGGVYNGDSTSVTISDSAVIGNTAAENGGGIHVNQDGTTILNRSLVSGNQAGDDGGGAYLQGFSDVSVSRPRIPGS